MSEAESITHIANPLMLSASVSIGALALLFSTGSNEESISRAAASLRLAFGFPLIAVVAASQLCLHTRSGESIGMLLVQPLFCLFVGSLLVLLPIGVTRGMIDAWLNEREDLHVPEGDRHVYSVLPVGALGMAAAATCVLIFWPK